MGSIIDGRAIAKDICEETAQRVVNLKAKGIYPKLAVVLAGDDPASMAYVRMKGKRARELGIDVVEPRFPADISERELLHCIHELNGDATVHGILVQLPLPKHISEERVLEQILPEKDVDGLHPINAGALYTGRKGFIPCTPKGCLKLIQSTGVDIAGKNCVVVGRSSLMGKPMAMLMLQENATVTICHSHTENLCDITNKADILIAAVGKAGMIGKGMIKPGAVVIDVGQIKIGDRFVGDVDFDYAMTIASRVTPVPGGTGPMTIAMLMENTVEAAERKIAE